MTDADRDREMERLAGELSTTLADLRDELDRASEPPRGPLGLPRPPTPGEVLRFTDELAIPAVIAILEANIRALEAFQGALRLARAGDEVRGRSREARARTETLSRGALDRLDDALVDLQGALEGRPENSEASTLLDDARALRTEIDDRLREAERRSDRGSPARDDRDDRGRDPWDLDEDSESGADEGVTIDVDAELDSIHDAIDEENERNGGRDGNDDNDEDQ
ncbi:hypothetical protein [Halococcus sp. IIIV-5B]|uniref:DUF7547 family protein n=1 Tax=Halococcus sp. IIIV-5B TaxID=2321230 RepID=UPI000E735ADA|nr:hypothetical protein [Halococcus sp. IIIV-5B]RJT03132.1 hypothetical protein D3261_11655 [Halococcus sp. IIIV-5B]